MSELDAPSPEPKPGDIRFVITQVSTPKGLLVVLEVASENLGQMIKIPGKIAVGIGKGLIEAGEAAQSDLMIAREVPKNITTPRA